MDARLFDDPLLPEPGHRTGAGTASMRVYIRALLSSRPRVSPDLLADLPLPLLEGELARRRAPAGCPCVDFPKVAGFSAGV
jgi:hypothetical protein